ncbi:hypothetical protein FDZ84_37115 [Saccharopolyspora sp. ASAGF58]|nr:hypothetical protein FDZ84_37115 [Saccharopolyspora sp. ASAGF58]
MRLYISKDTVKSRLCNIYRKFNLRNRVGADCAYRQIGAFVLITTMWLLAVFAAGSPIGAEIRKHRDSLGWTLEKLAEATDISRSDPRVLTCSNQYFAAWLG